MEPTNGTAPAFLRLAGHPLRWRLLRALAEGGDLRVRELAGLVDQPQNLVSYHLRLLRDGDLVTTTRSTFDGRDTYYHLDVDRCAAALAGVGPALHPALTLASTLTHAPAGPAAASQARLAAGPLAGQAAGSQADPGAGLQAGPGVGLQAGQAARPPTGMVAAPTPGPPAVLFVCTGNTARSPIAEALLRHYTGDRVRVTSAGTRPGPRLHPNTARVLREGYGIDISGTRPRHVHTLTGHRFDYVISLCDRAREAHPEFDHAPRRVHWSIPDPAAAGGVDEATYPAFAGIAADVDSRIRHLLPVLASTANP